ncbi:hypothetical protein FRB93_009336 [Tulasnella sp. JGI-2019a]|nr:hypothetical protein FRB93_009336 [Tulasnella sp. JGI-2019a]
MASVETETIYAPPPGPPPPKPSLTAQRAPVTPLRPTTSPIPLEHFAAAGWYPLPLSDPEYDPILEAYSDLFSLSETFFALLDTSPEKTDRHPTKTNKLLERGPKHWHTEDGWSVIPGEKQLLSIRNAQHAPPGAVRDGLAKAWKVTGPFLHRIMKDIALSLDLKEDAFDEMIEPCLILPGSEEVTSDDENGESEASPTLMRMFRYDRPVMEVNLEGEVVVVEPKIVSEAHRDLGLITLVIGRSPGLDVFYPPSFNAPDGAWLPIEEHELDEGHASESGLTATIMTGEALARLSNRRYRPGMHRVLVHPSYPDESPYRFSLVYALRPASKAVLETEKFQSAVTGRYPDAGKLEGKTGGVLMNEISSKLFNVNIGLKEREGQKRRMAEAKAKAIAEKAQVHS